MTRKRQAKNAGEAKHPKRAKTAEQSNQVSFMKLPAELRIKIYRFLLPNQAVPGRRCKLLKAPEYQSLRSDRDSCYPQILQTCRQIYEEASSIVYSLTFHVEVNRMGIELCGGSKFLGWKYYKSSIQSYSDAKQYLQTVYSVLNVFTRANELHIEIQGELCMGWDNYMQFASEESDGPVFTEHDCDNAEAAYDVKANVQLLADLLRHTACWRQEEGLPKPSIAVAVVEDLEFGDDREDGAGSSSWLIAPFSDVRACKLISATTSPRTFGPTASTSSKESDGQADKLDAVGKALGKSMSTDAATFTRDPKKHRMQTQLNHLMAIVERMGFDPEIEAIRREFYHARVAFDEDRGEDFKIRARMVFVGWEAILEGRRQQEAEIAESFNAMVGDCLAE